MKRETENHYQETVNKVIDYIQSHLQKSLQMEELARRFCLSTYHFHRIIRAYLGEPLSAYVTRQRLERAVLYMRIRPLTLIELADLTGFQTPQSLAKAFKKQFGITPTAYRKQQEELRTKHRAQYEPPVATIVEEPQKHLVYVRVIGPYGEPEMYTRAWKQLTAYLMAFRLLTKDTRWIGISFDDPHVTHQKQCRFYACATVSNRQKENGPFGTKTLPAGKYAVYIHTGDYCYLQQTYDAIYSHFPYRLQGGEVFEEYLSTDSPEAKPVTRIYIPIR